MSEEDVIYFTRRAHEERQRASVSECNPAALSHLKLADEYDRRAVEAHAQNLLTRKTLRLPILHEQ